MGYPCAERAYGAGRHDDVGDIDGIDGVVIECKNEKRINIPGYLKELEDAGIKLESNSFRGDKQLLALFESNPELVNHVHTKMREMCCA